MYNIYMQPWYVSDFPSEQKNAIETAARDGTAVFTLKDVNYLIKQKKEGFLVSATSVIWWDIIGSSFTHISGQHYSIKVDPKFRWRGIGKILFSTKQALDGLLRKEWSWRYSRIFFLIKHGYIPIARISAVHNPSIDRLLFATETKTIIEGLRYFYHDKRVWEHTSDRCPYCVRMLYAPNEAKKLLHSIESIKN